MATARKVSYRRGNLDARGLRALAEQAHARRLNVRRFAAFALQLHDCVDIAREAPDAFTAAVMAKMSRARCVRELAKPEPQTAERSWRQRGPLRTPNSLAYEQAEREAIVEAEARTR